MKYSLVPKLILGILLALTLSVKLYHSGSYSTSKQDAIVRTHIADFLERHGFEADRDGTMAVSARSGECRLIVTNVAPQGWHRDILHQFASEEDSDELFFVFRGRKYRDQPVWLTGLTYYWNRILRETGQKTEVAPVLGIIESPACNLGPMLWSELAENIATLL